MLLLRTTSAILFALLVAGNCAPAWATTYIKDTTSIEYAGFEGAVDIYRPGDGVSAGVAIIAHGFTRRVSGIAISAGRWRNRA
jgi:hypothetical protein